MTTATRTDMWPAELRIDPDAPNKDDRRHVYPVRVVVTLDEILVFTDGRPPTLVFRDRLKSYSPPTPDVQATKEQLRTGSNRQAIATTESGHVLVFTRASGCGCGSRLKVLSLPTLLAIADGTDTKTSASPSASTPFAAMASTKDK